MQASSQQLDGKGKGQGRRFSLSAVVFLVALLTSAVGAASGQYLLSEDVVRQFFRSQPILSFDRSISAILPGVSLLILSGVLLAAAARRPIDPVESEARVVARSHRLWLVLFQFAACFVGLGLAAYLAKNLLAGVYRPEFPLFLLAALAAFAVALLGNDFRQGLSFSQAWRRQKVWILAELGYLMALAALFFYLNTRDLDGISYAAIGDEYSFFNVARFIALGAPVNLFSQKGVYGYHPVADSAYQALVMDQFGINHYGWKLSGVLIVVISLFPLYLLVRHFFGVWSAAIASAITATSHYLFAYAHTGYNNIHALAPPVAAACAAAIGISKRSSALLFVAGAFAGLGFYTFFSARFAVVALVLAVLASGIRLSTIRLLFSAAAGFVVAAFPMLVVSRMDVINAMLTNSVAKGNANWMAVVEEVFNRTLQSLLGFNYSTTAVHYLSGSLLDPLSAALAAVGAVFALFRLTDWRYRFLLVWLVAGLVIVGGFYQGFNIAETRLMVLVPFMATFASVAVNRSMRAFTWHVGSRVLQAAMPPIILAVLLAFLIFANLQRFSSITPSRLPLRPESLAAEVTLSSDVDHSSFASAVVIAPAPDALARLVFDSYDLGPRNPILLSAGEKDSATLYADSPVIVFLESNPIDEKAIFSKLKEAAPEASLADEWDKAHMTRVGVVRNPKPVPSARLLQVGAPSGLRAVMRLGGLGKSQGRLNGPRDVAVDGEGNLYVADTGNSRVQKFDAGGKALMIIGRPTDSDGYLKAPVSVAVDGSGGIAVLDAENLDIKRFAANGRYLGRFGRDLGLASPRGITFDLQGNLYVADVGRVLKVSPEGQMIASVTSGYGGDSRLQLREPADVALDADGYLYIIDGATGTVTKLDFQGHTVLQWDTPARSGGSHPRLGIGPDGSLVVSVPEARRILKYGPTGQLQAAFSEGTLVGEKLEILAGLAVDRAGYVYVVDAGKHQLVRFAFF